MPPRWRRCHHLPATLIARAEQTVDGRIELGALVQAFAPVAAILVAGRLIVGLGVGVAAVAATLYAAELAPARRAASYQLAIALGIFLAYLIDGTFTNRGSWRWMLGLSAVPGVFLFVMALVTRKSPHWLMMKGRRDGASAEFLKINPGADARAERDAVAAALSKECEAASWGDVFDRQWRQPLMIGIGLAVFQQITGINAIIYYADQIFASVGFTTHASQTMVTTWAIGAVNVLATFIAFSMGPVVWTVINEIFPAQIRDRAVAVATAVNWATAFLVSQFFLSLIGAIGNSMTFWLFALFCGVSWVWVYFRVPETKGQSLEQIQTLWTDAKT